MNGGVTFGCDCKLERRAHSRPPEECLPDTEKPRDVHIVCSALAEEAAILTDA